MTAKVWPPRLCPSSVYDYICPKIDCRGCDIMVEFQAKANEGYNPIPLGELTAAQLDGFYTRMAEYYEPSYRHRNKGVKW